MVPRQQARSGVTHKGYRVHSCWLRDDSSVVLLCSINAVPELCWHHCSHRKLLHGASGKGAQEQC